MDKVRIGVVGAMRGGNLIYSCVATQNAEVVAICDKRQELLDEWKVKSPDTVTFYRDYDEFLGHDMDAVVLANYATEHAPFAIKALKAGFHVYSEVLPARTLKEAVELIETVEATGKIYAYGENYCYNRSPYEMRKLYREGKIGGFEYGECEYFHNTEGIWPALTYGEPDHWRNHVFSTYYCTHSLGPMIHITGLRPVSVIGLESPFTHRRSTVGSHAATFGMELVTLENGGIIKSAHGCLYKPSIWYSLYGTKGRMESERYDTGCTYAKKLYLDADEYEGQYNGDHPECYEPELVDEAFSKAGHGGADAVATWNFFEKVRGNEDADIIDVYEAMDMFLPGIFAYRSIMNGNRVEKIPDFRNREERDLYRNDVTCTDRRIAGDMYVPPCSLGYEEFPAEVYGRIRERFEEAERKKAAPDHKTY